MAKALLNYLCYHSSPWASAVENKDAIYSTWLTAGTILAVFSSKGSATPDYVFSKFSIYLGDSKVGYANGSH